MTRFEAAALLNACLDRITEVTDETRRLLNEFERELAVIKGRVDGLEARVGTLEAQQFSTTTKLEGQASFALGANNFGGDWDNHGINLQDQSSEGIGATTLNYDLQLALVTSFTGEDTLLTVLRSGNFGNTAFVGGGTIERGEDSSVDVAASNLSTLEFASGSGDTVFIDKLFYQLPLGNNLTATVGPLVGQEDMLAIWPSAYASEASSTVLDYTTLGGAPGAYSKNLGAGAGIWWQSDDGFAISANYVAANGANGNPNNEDNDEREGDCGGIATDCSLGSATVQIGYAADQWGIAGAYTWLQDSSLIAYGTSFLTSSFAGAEGNQANAFALSGYWMPEETGFIPSVSVGWGYNTHSYDDDAPNGAITESQSWTVGLEWNDAFFEGNAAGIAVGQGVMATELEDDTTPDDGNYVWEGWYRFQVTDNISITPAVFYLSRPLGQATASFDSSDTFSQLGGLVRTTFTF